MTMPSVRHYFGARRHRRPVTDAITVVRAWLRTNPEAWSGWPTYVVVTDGQRREARARLARYGCPYAALDFPILAGLVADLRAEHREAYVGQALRALDREEDE